MSVCLILNGAWCVPLCCNLQDKILESEISGGRGGDGSGGGVRGGCLFFVLPDL